MAVTSFEIDPILNSVVDGSTTVAGVPPAPVSALAVLARVGAVPGPVRAFPQPCPARRRLAADVFQARCRALARFPAARHELRSSMAAIGVMHPPRAVACSILHPTGPRRRFAAAHADMAALRAAAHRHGGTVNDLLLTAVAGAPHTLLERRGEPVGVLRVAVMVAGRGAAPADAPGNQVAR